MSLVSLVGEWALLREFWRHEDPGGDKREGAMRIVARVSGRPVEAADSQTSCN